MIEKKLPYFEERSVPIDTLVLHCLAYDVEQGLETFHQAKVSAHYMIGLNGRIYRLVDEDKCAWHAGKSFWRGRESLNKCSIGIEMCSPSLGQEPYHSKQIFAVIRLCRKLVRRYHIKPQNIVGHSDIAPTRKPDPGKAFPWKYLARYGIGLKYRLKDAAKITEYDERKMLKTIGYDVSDLNAAKTAFCRHFAPQFIATESNIMRLIENPCVNISIGDEAEYRQILRAVYYQSLQC